MACNSSPSSSMAAVTKTTNQQQHNHPLPSTNHPSVSVSTCLRCKTNEVISVSGSGDDSRFCYVCFRGNLFGKFRLAVTFNDMISPSDNVLVAFSGGTSLRYTPPYFLSGAPHTTIIWNQYRGSVMVTCINSTFKYKNKFLKATTSNIPSSVTRDNRGSKLTIGKGGMLEVQHLVSVSRPSTQHPRIDSAGYQPPSRIAYKEFFVKPEEEEDDDNVSDS